MTLLSPRCPDCESYHLRWDFTCHTWPSTGQGGKVTWMVCLPCDSAIEYYCMRCDWDYIHGMNLRNPRFIKEQENRPWWVDDKHLNGPMGIRTAHYAVRAYWEDDED